MPTHEQLAPVAGTPGSRSIAPASRVRWAGIAGRGHGDPAAPGAPLVLLHGLTFDRRMWDPVLAALPVSVRAIAFDLPGHGGSAGVRRRGLRAVVDAIRDAVLDARLGPPILVGHSIGGPIASLFAATYPAAGVVSIDAPIRLEPFAEALTSLRAQLQGDAFAQTWQAFRNGWHAELLSDAQRRHLVGEHASQQLVLDYQADLFERPLDEVLRWRDEQLRRVRDAAIPYVVLQANPVDPSDRAWLAERMPQAEVVVWPVRHHFPHLARPAALAELLLRLAWTPVASRAPRRS